MDRLDYLDLTLCKNHGHIFELFYDNGVDPVDTINKFVLSEPQRCYDTKNALATSQDILYFYEMFKEEYPVLAIFCYNNPVCREALFYAGFIMQYVSYREEVPVKLFFTLDMIVWLYNNYSVLHTQDNEYVLNLLLEMNISIK